MSLRDVLASGRLAITTEVIPPKGIDLAALLGRLRHVRGLVHAVDVADHPRAVARMSNLAVARLVSEQGLDPVLVVTCRDANVLALQGKLLGAHALGIENILCVRGDPPAGGDHPQTTGVYELTSAELVRVARSLARGVDAAGNPLRGAPRLHVGAIVDPGAEDLAAEIAAMEEKAAAGAEFFQTQAVYDVETYRRFRRAAAHIQVPVLAGLFLVESAAMARRLNATMRGSHVPDELIRRLDASANPLGEVADTLAEVARELAPVTAGLHIMSLNRLDIVAGIIRRAGLL